MSDYTIIKEMTIEPVYLGTEERPWFLRWLGPKQIWKWAIIEFVPWEVGYLGSGWCVIIEPGTLTDLASIPWWGQWLFNPYDPATAKASAVHDRLLEGEDGGGRWGQATAAGEFYACLKADKVPLLKRMIMYLAVLFGIDDWKDGRFTGDGKGPWWK